MPLFRSGGRRKRDQGGVTGLAIIYNALNGGLEVRPVADAKSNQMQTIVWPSRGWRAHSTLTGVWSRWPVCNGRTPPKHFPEQNLTEIDQ